MMAAWMAYAVVISLLLSVTALIAERLARLRKKQTRGIWMGALLLSLTLPLLFAWNDARPTSHKATTELLALTAIAPRPMYVESPIVWLGGASGASHTPAVSGAWLIGAWVAATALVLGSFLAGWLQMQRRLRGSRTAEVGGAAVTITADIGPAVLGFLNPRIVIPHWLLSADTATQAIAIAHEREHLRVDDVRVLGAAVLIVALFPWNLPLWWQLRRLRFALEVDCDARVLRNGHNVSEYGTALLNVATRVVPLRAAATALVESRSSLERRVRIMRTPLRRRWRATGVLLGSCCVALIAAAANVTVPEATLSEDAGGLPLLVSPVFVQSAAETSLGRAVAYFHPQLIERKQAGRPYVWAVVNEAGQVTQTALEVRPSWDTEAVFAENRSAYLQRAGVSEQQITRSIVLQMNVGPNYVVVAWVMQPGSIAQDPGAPRFTVASNNVAQAQILSTLKAQRAVIEHFDSSAISEGVPAGQELWFLIEADGEVLTSGRRAAIIDPQQARIAMQQLFPHIEVSYVTRGTALKDVTGKRVPVSWQWLERNSPLPR
jgi:hypothetical protein